MPRISSERATRGHLRAEKSSEVVDIGLQATDIVLRFGAVLPLARVICTVARNVLRDVQRLHDRADDVIAAGHRVVNVLETLQWIAENTKTLSGLTKESVDQKMRELERLLNAFHAAVCAFGRKGFFKKMFRVSKEAKTLKCLDRDIRDALGVLCVAYELGREHKFEEMLENPMYALEDTIERHIQERLNMGETLASAVEGLENDEAAIESIAIDGGVSDDVFRREIPEFPVKVRDHFQCFSHCFEELRNETNQLAMQQKCAENLTQHYAHVPVSQAEPDDPEHMKSMLGPGTFGETHRMRRLLDGRDCAVKFTSIRGAKCHSIFQGELRREAVVLSKLHHEHIVAHYEVRVVMTPWLGKCLAIVMEYVAGGTLLDRVTSSLEIDLETATKWLRQLASALAHVHSCRIQHRDLKLDNVLLDAQGDVPSRRLVRMWSRRFVISSPFVCRTQRTPENERRRRRFALSALVWPASTNQCRLVPRRDRATGRGSTGRRRRLRAFATTARTTFGAWAALAPASSREPRSKVASAATVTLPCALILSKHSRLTFLAKRPKTAVSSLSTAFKRIRQSDRRQLLWKDDSVIVSWQPCPKKLSRLPWCRT